MKENVVGFGPGFHITLNIGKTTPRPEAGFRRLFAGEIFET